MVFGLFSKKNDILNGIENKDVDEVTSYLKKLKNINEIFSRPDNEPNIYVEGGDVWTVVESTKVY